MPSHSLRCPLFPHPFHPRSESPKRFQRGLLRGAAWPRRSMTSRTCKAEGCWRWWWWWWWWSSWWWWGGGSSSLCWRVGRLNCGAWVQSDWQDMKRISLESMAYAEAPRSESHGPLHDVGKRNQAHLVRCKSSALDTLEAGVAFKEKRQFPESTLPKIMKEPCRRYTK